MYFFLLPASGADEGAGGRQEEGPVGEEEGIRVGWASLLTHLSVGERELRAAPRGSDRGAANEEELRGELNRGVAEGDGGIVVDLTECDFIDSSGVRALLLGREAQREDGDGGLVIASGSAQIVRILSVMGVDKAIPIRPTVGEAIAEL
jgi:anti-sigma B factor antagonist